MFLRSIYVDMWTFIGLIIAGSATSHKSPSQWWEPYHLQAPATTNSALLNILMHVSWWACIRIPMAFIAELKGWVIWDLAMPYYSLKWVPSSVLWTPLHILTNAEVAIVLAPLDCAFWPQLVWPGVKTDFMLGQWVQSQGVEAQLKRDRFRERRKFSAH